MGEGVHPMGTFFPLSYCKANRFEAWDAKQELPRGTALRGVRVHRGAGAQSPESHITANAVKQSAISAPGLVPGPIEGMK